MTPVIIVLLIIGVIFLIVSCFLVEKSSNSKTDFNIESLLESSEIDKENIKTSLEVKLNEVTEETLHKADVELGKLSNETIMEVSDYSNQVLEKINKNHEEVVFLYQMLNDKEEQLKKLIGQMDESIRSSDNRNNEDNLISTKHSTMEEVDSHVESTPFLNQENLNNNERIINLYTQGKSIMEIARELELGQGEVKLVLDLFVK